MSSKHVKEFVKVFASHGDCVGIEWFGRYLKHSVGVLHPVDDVLGQKLVSDVRFQSFVGKDFGATDDRNSPFGKKASGFSVLILIG